MNLEQWHSETIDLRRGHVQMTIKSFLRPLAILVALTLASCASTSSTVLAPSIGAPKVALLPLEGPLGAQAADLISQELASNGIATVERGRTVAFLAVDTDIDPASPAAAQTFAQIGDTLGVRYLFVGTVSAEEGPLYSFPHVNLTLRLIDVRTGQTRWIGRYGNAAWTSAISQQGDLQRGAKAIVREFIKSGGPALLAD